MASEKTQAAQRQITILGLILAAVGVIGLIAKPSLLIVWVFLIVFGLIRVPEQLWRWWKARNS